MTKQPFYFLMVYLFVVAAISNLSLTINIINRY